MVAIEYTAQQLVDMADNKGYIYISTNSSYVEAICYDLFTGNMVVVINGMEYAYYGRSLHELYRFVNAPSKGSFYNTYVRGRW
jgi:hypothetical protein